MTAFCAQNTFINANADVFVGFVAWAAGSFSPSYVLSLTPSKQGGQFVDGNLMTQCVMAPWLNAKNVTAPAPAPARPALPTTVSAARPPSAPSGSAPAPPPAFSANSTSTISPRISATPTAKPTTTSASFALTGSTSVLSLGEATYSISMDSRTDIVMPATLPGLTMTTLLMATGTPKRPSATGMGGAILTAPGAAPLAPPAGATSFPSPNAPPVNPSAAPSPVVSASGSASLPVFSGGLLACAVLALML